MAAHVSRLDPASEAEVRSGTRSDEDVLAWLTAQEQKDLLRFVTIGSVDDGKSTLIGRLLHDAHGLYEDQLNAVRRASQRGSTRGEASASEVDFSLVTDGLAAEREQGITIDVAYRYFSTEKRKFIIADTPGHVQYTRNMATGASTADVAVILVDARLGVLPQTRRHAHIAALLGIPHVVACVNKMDLVGWDQGVFAKIQEDLGAVARAVGLAEVFPIPISALRGDNVVEKSAETPYWRGPSLLEHLEAVNVQRKDPLTALRLPVQLVLRPHQNYRGFAGQILAGSIKPGDTVISLPSGKSSRVKAVDVHGSEVAEAVAPMNVAVRLEDEIDVSRGCMLASPDALPQVATDLEADLIWMNERPLEFGKTYLLKHTTRTVRASVDAIDDQLDLETLARMPSPRLGLNDIARVHVRCRAPIFFDAYATSRAAGAFILIDVVTNDTVAAGMIRGARDVVSTVAARSLVTDDERRQRFGHAGAVVRIHAPTLDEARALAFGVERLLFDGSRIATVLDGEDDRAAELCASAGLLALVPTIRDSVGASILQGGAWTISRASADELASAVEGLLASAGVT